MQADIFVRRRNGGLLLVGAVAALTVGSIIITQYDVVSGFTSIGKALTWGASNFYPDAKSMQDLPDILRKLWETVLMAVAATTTASVIAVALALAGSRSTRVHPLVSVGVRAFASFFRNFPLVGWAMVLLLTFSQSQLTGYLALLFGSVGYLTRAFMETIDEVGIGPIEALRATGAGYLHIIFQAVLPASLPLMISWLLFMIDTNIRDAVLVGLLTGTGIGFLFDLYYKSFEFHAASVVTIVAALAVIVVEIASTYIRRIIL
ncbi:MAG TPA: ABC transporter permease subunit [Nitrolancea sp.]|jgi:phosphonate transport system permease protein|nr:ABC transporter permease subunit [Nitrolancea sp.]